MFAGGTTHCHVLIDIHACGIMAKSSVGPADCFSQPTVWFFGFVLHMQQAASAMCADSHTQNRKVTHQELFLFLFVFNLVELACEGLGS